MKNIRKKIATVVCGITLLCGITYTSFTKQSEECAIVVVQACDQAGMGIICREGSLSDDLIRRFAYAIADDLCNN